MDITTLNKANVLNKKINECQEALNCFDYKFNDEDTATYDRTPRLLLDVDDLDGGREQIYIPMSLSNEIISFLKTEITRFRDEAVKEFNNL